MGVLSERQKAEALELLVECIETITVNPKGNEESLAEKIRCLLEREGCAAQLQIVSSGRANVVARLKGKSAGSALLVNGHLDTVPFGDEANWKTNPAQAVIQDGWLFGRGSSDMKSGLCAALYAFVQLIREGFIPENDIIFLGTADEETGGLGAQAFLESGFVEKLSGILIGEPTGGALSLAAKGTTWLEFELSGKSSHAAYPKEGVNAAQIAIILAQKLQTLVEEQGVYLHPLLSAPSCTLTQIHGGVKVNMVPDRCAMTLDIRTLPGTDHLMLLEKIDGIVADLQAQFLGVEIDMRVTNHRMAVSTCEDEPVVQAFCKTVEERTGSLLVLTASNFFSDASVFCQKWDVPVLLYGPGEAEQAHKPNECVSLEKYFEVVEGYVHFMKTC